jgi:hypothetical protein
MNKKTIKKTKNTKKIKEIRKYTKEAVSIYQKALRKLAYT